MFLIKLIIVAVFYAIGTYLIQDDSYIQFKISDKEYKLDGGATGWAFAVFTSILLIGFIIQSAG